MPLYKRTPFSLVESPQDLDPHELVFQVRFTKEIFKDYQQYLDRINLYRQRVWTCKFSGKTNLTYEEALVSEQRATEKVQQFPKELVGPVLHMVQYSTLKLKDLVTTICRKLQERLLEGVEVYVRKEQSVCPCKILKFLEDSDKLRYEVGWLDKDKNVTGSAVVNAEDLIRKKLPFSRDVVKSFIRESTSQSSPWIIHEKLAREHGIPTDLPDELQEKLSTQIECGSKKVKKKKNESRKQEKEDKQGEISKKKRKNADNENSERLTMAKKAKEEEEKPKEEPIKYPIDDLLVQPGPDDPVFSDRPSLSRDFSVPMDSVGDLLMVWDFCTSFSRSLNLWPFSLEDFQNAICHKDNNLVLIVESHSALLHLLIKEEGQYYAVTQKKNRKGKISLVTWTNYLCDFLEMEDMRELSSHSATIRRGYYGLLETQTKLGIFRELVNEAVASSVVREQLDTYMEQRKALAYTKWEVAMEEARKKREKKELQKVGSDTNNVAGERILENGNGQLHTIENGDHKEQNGHVPEETDGDLLKHKKKSVSGNRESMNIDMPSKNASLKQKTADYVKDLSSNEEPNKAPKRIRDNEKKDHLEREIEKRFVRTAPLGKDKNYNRYWFFGRDGRIFVESPDSKLWGYYNSKEELDALIGSLNPKGERERALKIQLEKSYQRLCLGLQKRSKYIVHKIAMEEAVLRRSSRVQTQRTDSPSMAFLGYVNKFKDN